MKRFLKTFSASIVATLTLVPFVSGIAFAASASLSLSPSASSVVNGSSVTVSIYENSGSEPVNAVQANFSYSASLLQFVSINNAAAFPVAAQSTGGSGSVAIARAAYTPVTGSQLVASVSFKAIASSGTATLSFTGG